MIEMLVMYLDRDGIPRAYASGLIESNKDLEILKEIITVLTKIIGIILVKKAFMVFYLAIDRRDIKNQIIYGKGY